MLLLRVRRGELLLGGETVEVLDFLQIREVGQLGTEQRRVRALKVRQGALEVRARHLDVGLLAGEKSTHVRSWIV